MAVFNVAGYLIEERRRWHVIIASPRGQCSKYIQMRKPYQSSGRMKNSSYYIAPVGDWTHDLPYTVSSNMINVSHALNHSATAWFISFSLTIFLALRPNPKFKNEAIRRAALRIASRCHIFLFAEQRKVTFIANLRTDMRECVCIGQ